MKPIAIARTTFKERYGTPYQATSNRGLAEEWKGEQEPQIKSGYLELILDHVPLDAIKDLEGFEYIWAIAFMHMNNTWHPLVRPPREPDPHKKHGVFATRSPHRPNFVAMSALKVERIEGHRIHVESLDFLDNTPILDIKPYLPYADAFPDAKQGWTETLDNSR